MHELRKETVPTEQEIIDQTNELAREVYRLRGYVVPDGHKFYEFDRTNYHPHERFAWNVACAAQQILNDTDVENALIELGYEPE